MAQKDLRSFSMIKKLTLQDDTRILCRKDYMLALRYVQQTINQLVDAVNELQKHEEQHLDLLTELNEMRLHQKKEPAENVQDKFAEQRKWIGKLCWFWNNDNEPDTCFGVLTGLFDEADRPFERSIGQQLYRYCEPVKPDDDIIYKGGDNE